uniref:Tektin n=1 Tax=Cyprinus carpio carpio TaxID=630221 RepID=A0A8C1CAP8_CYPCA
MSSQILVSRPYFDTRVAAAKYIPEEWFTNDSTLLNRAVADRNQKKNFFLLTTRSEKFSLSTRDHETIFFNDFQQEVELIRSIQALLKKTLDQTVNQIRPSDWSGKQQAYSLDDRCGCFNNRSTDTQQHLSSAVLQGQVCDEEVWRKFTGDNLRLAEREEVASQALRRLIERVLQETSEDLRAQCAAVDQAFNQRCMEVSQAKTQLELHLAQAIHTYTKQKSWLRRMNISSLQQAVYDKEAPLRVAESRLHYRTFRPNMELCRDQPYLCSLLGEASELNSKVSALQQQLYEACKSLSDLKESRLFLEKDISCKTKEKCMTHRTCYPSVTVLSGY